MLNDHLQVYIDNNRWMDINDSRANEGWILMFAEPGSKAQVDDIKVWQIGE